MLSPRYFLLFLISSCRFSQSVLHPVGDAADKISGVFWWMLAGAIIIWTLFIALLFFSLKMKPHEENVKQSKIFIIGGGTLIPIIIITTLIYLGLRPLPELLRPAPKGSLVVKVSGLQWWWRVNYVDKNEEVELANEIWLPVNEPVQFLLSSEDVIHSFWIPSMAGKVDMIPGRETRLTFTPTKIGHYTGVCAEYCGTSHALMRLDVRVVTKKVFHDWLQNQKQIAKAPETKLALKGKKAFLAHGCASCHSVRGVRTSGLIAPDLTHVGSRMRLGAGLLKNDIHSLHRFISEIESMKPDVKMPSVKLLPAEDRKAMAAWLKGLK